MRPTNTQPHWIHFHENKVYHENISMLLASVPQVLVDKSGGPVFTSRVSWYQTDSICLVCCAVVYVTGLSLSYLILGWQVRQNFSERVCNQNSGNDIKLQICIDIMAGNE